MRHESGDKWAAKVLVRGLNQGNIFILGEPAGSRRIPSHNLLDMRIEKEFPFYSGQLRFAVDIFNMFNSFYALKVEDRFDSERFGMPIDQNEARQIQLGLRYTF